MSVSLPGSKPPLLKTLEVDFGTTIAASIWRKVIDHLNFLNEHVPIGIIIWFYGTQTYADGGLINLPNGTIWKFCDGSMINNTLSPIDNQPTPDLRDRFIKMGSNFGDTGGSDTLDLTHYHGEPGGTTFITTDLENLFGTDSDNERQAGNTHRHSIDSEVIILPKIPPFQYLSPYMRIV